MKKIAVFGNGLAGLFCVAKLLKVLPEAVELTYIAGTEDSQTDIFFGSVTPPSTYDFLLGLGLTEPDVLPSTNTNFSLGTRYINWGPNKRSWTQSFHRPLPIFNGVDFHHYLTRLNLTSPDTSPIEPYLMSVQASNKGVFAHPPEGKNIPLADVEYGYHFLPEEWAKLIKSKLEETSVKWVDANVTDVVRQGDRIQFVSLSDGQTLEADFVIDAMGPNSKLTLLGSQTQQSERKLRAVSAFTPIEKAGDVCRTVVANDVGWISETPLRQGTYRLSIISQTSTSEALGPVGNTVEAAVDLKLGRLEKPWIGNCLTLGHGAAVVEPLTLAPILLLQRDVERLAELIPVSADMMVESREYNRRFQSDYDHATLFSQAFFVCEATQDTPYWKAACAAKLDEKLLTKIKQFENRGIAVQYDYEPFNAQDWTMLHFGMGRHPSRYDPLADQFPEVQLKNKLGQMRTAIEIMAKKMPPHHVYVAGLLKYLKEKHG